MRRCLHRNHNSLATKTDHDDDDDCLLSLLLLLLLVVKFCVIEDGSVGYWRALSRLMRVRIIGANWMIGA